MNKFKITVTMDKSKNLTLTETVNQNQGENNSSVLDIFVPAELATDRIFFVEFLCPKNKRFVSPQLDEVAATADAINLRCDIPSCVLQEEGFVQLQLVSYNKLTGEEIYKSNYSAKVSFFVHASVNASQVYSTSDYFTNMSSALENEKKERTKLSESFAVFEQKVLDLENDLHNHTKNTENPHGVTKAQVGLDKVDNTADIIKSVNSSFSAGTDYIGRLIHKTYATVAELNSVKAFAENKRTAHCYDTYDIMVEALKDSRNQFEIGDTVYIKDSGVPDYWISGKTTAEGEYGYYELSLLETEKVNLAPYQTVEDAALETENKTVTQAINENKRRLDEQEAYLMSRNAQVSADSSTTRSMKSMSLESGETLQLFDNSFRGAARIVMENKSGNMNGFSLRTFYIDENGSEQEDDCYTVAFLGTPSVFTLDIQNYGDVKIIDSFEQQPCDGDDTYYEHRKTMLGKHNNMTGKIVLQVAKAQDGADDIGRLYQFTTQCNDMSIYG